MQEVFHHAARFPVNGALVSADGGHGGHGRSLRSRVRNQALGCEHSEFASTQKGEYRVIHQVANLGLDV